MPVDPRHSDISRVREYLLNGRSGLERTHVSVFINGGIVANSASQFRQTILLSAWQDGLINAVYNRQCFSLHMVVLPLSKCDNACCVYYRLSGPRTQGAPAIDERHSCFGTLFGAAGQHDVLVLCSERRESGWASRAPREAILL